MEELRKHIETIIKNTFEKIDAVYETNQEKDTNKVPTTESRLIFPKYSGKEETRISEQELRFLFVEEFNKYLLNNNQEPQNKPLNLFYSIETPTHYRFRFPQQNKDVPRAYLPSSNENEGESASFDLVIYNHDRKRVALIEFKKDGGSAHQMAKDFLKLAIEPGYKERTLRYFIMISSSQTPFSDKSPRGKNLKKAMLEKFEQQPCFTLLKEQNKNIEGVIWNKVCVFWHRLPCDPPKDTNDFYAEYTAPNKLEIYDHHHPSMKQQIS